MSAHSPYHLQWRRTRLTKWEPTSVSAKRPEAIRNQLRDYEAQLAQDHNANYACIELRIVTNCGMEIHRLDRDGDHYGPSEKP